jgi:hypothetical protein
MMVMMMVVMMMMVTNDNYNLRRQRYRCSKLNTSASPSRILFMNEDLTFLTLSGHDTRV